MNLERDLNDLLQTIDRVEKIKDIAITGGLAYLGYQTFGSWQGALFGLLADRLASNTGGAGVIPNVSRVLGLSMLGFLGATTLTTHIAGAGADLPASQTVRDVDTGRMIKYDLIRTDAGWQYVRAEGEPPPVIGPAITYAPGAQIGEYVPLDNPYI